jgi:hypothetical protein
MSLWGDVINGFTANKAAKKQEASTHAASVRSEAATKESIAQNEKMYGIGMGMQKPYLDGGVASQNKLMQLMGLGNNPYQTKEQIRGDLLSQFTNNQPQRRGSRGPNGENLLAMPSSSIDEAGLNAAIDKQFNSQNQGGDFGSLNKQFGAGDFNADPGYQWRLAQGQKGIDRSMAARGGLLSGAAVKASADYNQGAASQEYGNAYNRFNQDQNSQYNRLAGMIGTGQHAADYAGGLGSNLSSNNANLRAGNALNVGNNLIQGANARAGGYMVQGRAASNMANEASDYMKSAFKFGV